jgi:hypothetical protein
MEIKRKEVVQRKRQIDGGVSISREGMTRLDRIGAQDDYDARVGRDSGLRKLRAMNSDKANQTVRGRGGTAYVFFWLTNERLEPEAVCHR